MYNSVKLSHAVWGHPRQRGHGGEVYRMWSTGEGNGKPLQYSCLENPMNCSMPGLLVHHQLPEFTQTQVHRAGDAIHPSHPLSSLLLLLPVPSSIRVFSNGSTLCMRWPKYWSFSFSIIPSKEHPGLISFRMDWLGLLALVSLITLGPQPCLTQ